MKSVQRTMTVLVSCWIGGMNLKGRALQSRRACWQVQHIPPFGWWVIALPPDSWDQLGAIAALEKDLFALVGRFRSLVCGYTLKPFIYRWVV